MIYAKLDPEAANTAHSYHLHFFILMSNIFIICVCVCVCIYIIYIHIYIIYIIYIYKVMGR